MRRINWVIPFGICLLISFSVPQVARGETQMNNQVGIEFENDYTPTDASSSEEPQPSGGGSTVQPSGNVSKPAQTVSGGKTYFPQAGEQRKAGFGLLGAAFLAIAAVVFYRKKTVNR